MLYPFWMWLWMMILTRACWHMLLHEHGHPYDHHQSKFNSLHYIIRREVLGISVAMTSLQPTKIIPPGGVLCLDLATIITLPLNSGVFYLLIIAKVIIFPISFYQCNCTTTMGIFPYCNPQMIKIITNHHQDKDHGLNWLQALLRLLPELDHARHSQGEGKGLASEWWWHQRWWWRTSRDWQL